MKERGYYTEIAQRHTEKKNSANLFENTLCISVQQKTIKKASMKRILSILLILLITSVAYSQNYPVLSGISIAPPYSVYLSDYASMTSNKLVVNMMLKDPMEPNVNITLRVNIKGNGIELRTRDDYRPQAIQLDGGIPLIISGSELESYLNPANLTFSGISKNEFMKTGKLPEGVYQFFVEAMSFDRPGRALSNQGMAVAWLVLNDPPHWTLPMQNSLLTATYPQYVNFSWMPMNTGSPNAAFTTEYEFTIVEMWPEDRAPGDAINSFVPLYQTTTSNTSLAFGPAEPELTPGRKYVCRLRAYDTEGRDLFKNKGYSDKLINEVWDQIKSFAGYAFAKGHSASYAVESYQSLFLKCYFPIEFMVAVLNNGGGFYSTEHYLHEAKMQGATIK